mmetsp:Transcript_46141/g.149933  ORF Transcript_46141/g.149933 Transcript_46141/m.149933 type:complete len:205 (-) Transcript_46141:120-734(-)
MTNSRSPPWRGECRPSSAAMANGGGGARRPSAVVRPRVRRAEPKRALACPAKRKRCVARRPSRRRRSLKVPSQRTDAGRWRDASSPSSTTLSSGALRGLHASTASSHRTGDVSPVRSSASAFASSSSVAFLAAISTFLTAASAFLAAAAAIRAAASASLAATAASFIALNLADTAIRTAHANTVMIVSPVKRPAAFFVHRRVRR